MRYKVKLPGLYGNEGEIAVGTIIETETVPDNWAPFVESLDNEATEEHEPAPNGEQSPRYEARERGGGWWAIFEGEEQVTKGVRKDDADRFAALDAEGQAAFIEEHKED
jgi:hypothetical protein